MSGGIALEGITQLQDVGSSLSNSEATLISGSSSVNTKGSYAQLIASTSVDAAGLLLQIETNSNADSTLTDLAIGASGSEQIIAANLIASSFSLMVYRYVLPAVIPAGSRIAARGQSSSASDSWTASCTLFDVSLANIPGEMVDTYGANTATTLGTTVDPGGTANTKGSFTQIAASTTRDHIGLILGFDNQNAAAPNTHTYWLVDIAVGGSGSEQVIIPNLLLCCSAGQFFGAMPPLMVAIPAGTRLSARAQCSSATTGTRQIGLTIYGLS